MYGKIFTSIFDGSLYGEFDATVLMMALVVLADRHGEVDMTPQALSARTGYPLDVVERGLITLAQPDPRSRSKDEDGRRIVPLDPERDWGWRLVNYEKFRETVSAEQKRENDRQRIAEKRALARVSLKSRKVSQPVADVAYAEAEVEAEAEADGRDAPTERKDDVICPKPADHIANPAKTAGSARVVAWPAKKRSMTIEEIDEAKARANALTQDSKRRRAEQLDEYSKRAKADSAAKRVKALSAATRL